MKKAFKVMAIAAAAAVIAAVWLSALFIWAECGAAHNLVC